jgi:L-rhamnose mutarotase
MLQRVVFAQWVKAGSQNTYIEAHSPNHIWPEIVSECQAAGMTNYTGFIGGPNGRLVVGYFEVEDIDKMNDYLAKSKVNTEWSKKIVPFMETGD